MGSLSVIFAGLDTIYTLSGFQVLIHPPPDCPVASLELIANEGSFETINGAVSYLYDIIWYYTSSDCSGPDRTRRSPDPNGSCQVVRCRAFLTEFEKAAYSSGVDLEPIINESQEFLPLRRRQAVRNSFEYNRTAASKLRRWLHSETESLPSRGKLSATLKRKDEYLANKGFDHIELWLAHLDFYRHQFICSSTIETDR